LETGNDVTSSRVLLHAVGRSVLAHSEAKFNVALDCGFLRDDAISVVSGFAQFADRIRFLRSSTGLHQLSARQPALVIDSACSDSLVLDAYSRRASAAGSRGHDTVCGKLEHCDDYKHIVY